MILALLSYSNDQINVQTKTAEDQNMNRATDGQVVESQGLETASHYMIFSALTQ